MDTIGEFADMGESGYIAELHQALVDDDKDKFVFLVKFILDSGILFYTFSLGTGKQLLLGIACSVGAVKCTAALIDEESPLIVDIHSPVSSTPWWALFGIRKAWRPLHHAAIKCKPGVTELLLYLGARTDVKCDHHRINKNHQKPTLQRALLPLELALHGLSFAYPVRKWSPEHSIFKLLAILCMPRVQHSLETIGMLAWTTKATEKIFLDFARNGEVVKVAALLIVARKKLIDPITNIRREMLTQRKEGYLSYLTLTQSSALISEEEKRGILKLLDVFETAGDDIEAYVKKEKVDVSAYQLVTEVTCLLQPTGLKPEDTEITDLNWLQFGVSQFGDLDTETESSCKPKDIGMPHYSKSGYRWTEGYRSTEYREVEGYKDQKASMEKPVTSETFQGSLFAGLFSSLRAHQNMHVSGASTISKFHTAVEVKAENSMKQLNALSSKSWASFASVIKRALKRI